MKKLFVFLVVVGLVIVGSGLAQATLLVDRGLPTANLNNAAGANRSNVAWADGATGVVDGDDFKIGGTETYKDVTIRVWSISSTGSLWFGAEGETFTKLEAPVSTKVTYVGGQTYQGSSGKLYDLFQLDFNVNQVLSGATTYEFFLDGPTTANYAFLHSSNATLSGSLQQGANDFMLSADIVGGVLGNVQSWDSNAPGVWDKSSDGNVRVYGTQVPEPFTMLFLGFSLMGVAGARKYFRK